MKYNSNPGTRTFSNGGIWPDTAGVHINAHGGGLLKEGGLWYWYGEHKTAGKAGNVANVGVHVYSSPNLGRAIDLRHPARRNDRRALDRDVRPLAAKRRHRRALRLAAGRLPRRPARNRLARHLPRIKKELAPADAEASSFYSASSRTEAL